MSTCLAAKAFWILPMAISLPGICFEEKTTRSPLSSLIECVSPAIRASAARGSPCPPVAMIITLLRGMRMASSKSTRCGKSLRYPAALALVMIRSRERPATQSVRPISFATWPNVCKRAAFEAKVVTSTRFFAPVITSSKPAWTSPSDPLSSGLKTLVLSHTSASTPSSPIAVRCSGVDGSPNISRSDRSEEHTSELQSLMRISYADFCLKKKKKQTAKEMNTIKINKHDTINIIKQQQRNKISIYIQNKLTPTLTLDRNQQHAQNRGSTSKTARDHHSTTIRHTLN